SGSVLPWLLTVATNVVRDERRSTRRWLAALRRVPPDPDAVDEGADQVADPGDGVRRLRVGLQGGRRLPRAEREALLMCVWSSVSYVDAATLLGISESSVRARVSRARGRLNRALSRGATKESP